MKGALKVASVYKVLTARQAAPTQSMAGSHLKAPMIMCDNSR